MKKSVSTGATSTHVIGRIETRVARFCIVRDTKNRKMYQMNKECTKWSLNISNVHKMLKMAIKYINFFQSKALQNLHKLVFLV
jgi:hypothetical protein